MVAATPPARRIVVLGRAKSSPGKPRFRHCEDLAEHVGRLAADVRGADVALHDLLGFPLFERLQLVGGTDTLVFITGMAGAYVAFVPAGGSAIELAPPDFYKDGHLLDSRPCRPGWDRNTPGTFGHINESCILTASPFRLA